MGTPHTSALAVNGVPLGLEAWTISEMVSDEYLCVCYGKWHLGDDPALRHGFDRWLSIEDATLAHREVVSGLRLRDSAAAVSSQNKGDDSIVHNYHKGNGRK